MRYFPPFGLRLPPSLKDTRHLDEAARYDLLSLTIPDFIFSRQNPLIWQNEIRLPYILDNLGDMHGIWVADLGCGWGFLANKLADAGAKVVGLDISRETLKLAANKAENTELKAELVQGRAETLPFGSTFDVVTVTDVLEHIENFETVIAEASRILKVGGSFFFVTVNKTLLARMVYITFGETFFRLLPRGTHCYKRFIRPGELVIIMKKYGLILEDLKGILVNPFFKCYHFWHSKAIEYLGRARKVER